MVRANVLSLLLAGASAAALSGCADNSGSLIIRQNNVPEEGCAVPGDLGDKYRSGGQLDVSDPGPGFVAPLGYLFTPGVQSALLENKANPSDNVVIIEGATIELRAVNSARSEAVIAAIGAETKRDQRTSGSITPGGTIGMGFEIIDDSQALALRGAVNNGESVQIVAEVRIYGSVEGTYVESNRFAYPVTVCKGCGFQNVGNCSDIPAGSTGAPGGICRPMADGFLQCCTAPDGKAVCPAVGTMPMP
jgi:hypothetical protein